jgi:hypothetical protein
MSLIKNSPALKRYTPGDVVKQANSTKIATESKKSEDNKIIDLTNQSTTKQTQTNEDPLFQTRNSLLLNFRSEIKENELDFCFSKMLKIMSMNKERILSFNFSIESILKSSAQNKIQKIGKDKEHMPEIKDEVKNICNNFF